MRRSMLESKRARATQVQVQEQAPYIRRSEIHQSVYGMGKRSAETRPDFLLALYATTAIAQACLLTDTSPEICFRNNVYCKVFFSLHPKLNKGITNSLIYWGHPYDSLKS